MTQNILCIYYSQTGQLGRIIDNFCKPLQSQHNVEIVNVSLQKTFEFPWSGKDFFEAMPDSVLGKTVPLEDLQLKRDQYDLIIFGYQPWFLSPSIPATSILKDPRVQSVMKGTPVITVIGARNMWLNSQEKIKKLLVANGADLVGNVAFVDKANNWSSAVSIVYWQLYGKKDRLLGIFPKPGITEADIQDASRFGEIVRQHIADQNLSDLQPAIAGAGGVEVRHNIMFIESKAGRLFSIWANLISKRKNRDLWLTFFKYYLAIALYVLSPFVVLIDMLLFRPFTIKTRNKKRRYFQGVSLSEE